MTQTDYIATNAASSGVRLDRKQLKSIAARSDRPGIIYLLQWTLALALSGGLVWMSLGTLWVWPAMLIYGIFLAVPCYAMSHECAHGTAFRSRWLNESVFWLTSLLYMEEPLHRRYTHTNHHTHTWFVGKDSQMPFDTPISLGGWLTEITGFALLRFHISVLWHLASGRYTGTMRMVAPEEEFPKMTRNARVMLGIYALIASAPFMGVWWPIWFLVLPRLLGAPVMLLFTLLQHVELQENSPSILNSTRSFTTNQLAQFLYMNMNHHVEHHLYPQVPFHALPELARALKDQVPDPDHGLFRSNLEVFVVALRRSLGLSTQAPSLRQAAHIASDDGKTKRIAHRTM